MFDEKICLDFEKCIQMFENKEIYVFGTGIDSEYFVNKISDYVHILAFVDNNRYGDNRFFCTKKILNMEQLLQYREAGQPILIATYRFAKEICKQLENYGLKAGIDYFIWDDMRLFCMNENTKKYILFLKNIWEKHKKYGTNRILLPFDNRHDLQSIIYAYCGNHFAEKHNAVIYGYLRFGMLREDTSPVIEEIYKAFNVQDLIDSTLNEEQQKEADEICCSLWNCLSTWEDWKNITIYGIHFGTTIIRHLLRVYIPSFDLKDEKMHSFLKKSVNAIVFWYHYIFENDISIVLLADGVSWDGYIRDIAITKGIPTYALGYKMAKMTLDYCDKTPYQYFDKMWEDLTLEEQKYGIEWAKKQIDKRLKGGTDEIACTSKSIFALTDNKEKKHVLEQNNKMKIVICPHIFEEDCYWCGEQLFDDNYFSWLCHVGDLSEKMLDYDWYLKMHPCARRRDRIINDMILKKYLKIKEIPSDVSPFQLREDGVKYALTVCGTIGHEYPEIGIQVINAGLNPHDCFDFCWNPKSKEEYDNLILHLNELEAKTDEAGIYKFYCLNYLYYDWEYIPYKKLFFKNPLLPMSSLELEAKGKTLGTWKYDEYMKEWTKETHDNILIKLDEVFQKLDAWKPDVLYRKNNNMTRT